MRIGYHVSKVIGHNFKIIKLIVFLSLTMMVHVGWSSEPVPLASNLAIRAVIQSDELSNEEKIEKLKEIVAEEGRTGDLAAEVMLQKLLFEAGLFEQIVTSVERKTGLLVEFHWYYRGLALQKLQKHQKAIRFFKKIKDSDVSRALKLMARAALVDSQIQLGHWKSARKQLKYLERRKRGDADYPEILYKLIAVERKNRNSWRACRWAKKIYSRFPAHELVAGWGIDLRKAEFDGQRLGCRSTLRLKKRRLKRLHLAGRTDQAFREMLKMTEDIGDHYGRDIIHSEFLITIGEADKAVNRLLGYHEERQNDVGYLNLLARAAGKTGDTELTTYSYLKVHSKSPRGRRGRKALFSAAIINYQHQNYDLALEIFENWVKKYPRASRIREVEWYIGWIRYLRGDYRLAIQRFDKILHRIRRRWRGWRRLPSDKYQYWKAMSLYKMGDHQQARALFDRLGDKNLMSFYHIAAAQRIKSIDSGQEIRRPALNESGADFSVELIDSMSDNEVIPSGQVMVAVSGSGQGGSVSSDVEIIEVGDSEQEGGETDVEEEGAEDLEKEDEEGISGVAFGNKRFKRHFKRAIVLDSLGMNRLAKWELYEVERRTSRKEHRQALVDLYNRLGLYSRSAYLSQVYFGAERGRYKIAGVRHLWEAAYPKAFAGSVTRYSQNFGTPEQLTWSIMRAESIYKPEARSPVGALGLMQVMPHTGNMVARMLELKEFEADSLLTPDRAIQIGSRYLARLHRRFAGEVPLIAGAYNAGPHRMKGWLKSFGSLDIDEFIEHIPFRETRGYVKRVVRNYHIYNQVYAFQNDSAIELMRPPRVNYSGSIPLKEDWN